jgi:hypothetical protein
VKRFWVRWYCTGPKKGRKPKSLQWWVSGYRMVDDASVCCGIVDAESERAAVSVVMKYFREPELDFADEKPAGWTPGDRFPGAR